MASVSTSLGIHDKMTKTVLRQVSSLDKMIDRMEKLDRVSEQLDPGAGFDSALSRLEAAEARLNSMEKAQVRVTGGADRLRSIWARIGPLIGAAAAALGVNKIIGLADTMTQTTARLNLMNDGLQTTAELQDKILASANRSRAAYQTTADAASKMGIMARDAFSSSDEIIAFLEQVNKQFTIAGTSSQGIDAAMLQLTQAMASGVLRGEELNSIFEQAPTIIQSIADYMNVPIGQIRSMAQEGQITSEIVKSAMFASADETNRKFAEMPMTFSQVGTILGNTLLQTFEPVIQTIGSGAQFIYDNWSTIEPIFWGLAAAVGAYALITGIWTAVTWLQVAANRALVASMLSNPIGWIALAIGVVIGLIYKWVESVGGLRIAWMMVCNTLLTGWDMVKIGFFMGIYWVMDHLDKMKLGFMVVAVHIANYMGDMKANVLMILQNLVNGAIEIINGFISKLNKIPGVNIGFIEEVTFGTTAQLENEAAKQARERGLAAYSSQIADNIADRDAKLNQMVADMDAASALRKAEIASAKAEKAQQQGDQGISTVDIVGEVGKINEDVNIAVEDLKLLRDIAEARFVQNFVTLTPQVSMQVENVNENADVALLADEIERRLEEEFVVAAEGVYE